MAERDSDFHETPEKGNGWSTSRLAFFAYAYNLAETTRAVEVGRALRGRGTEVHFFTHGGPHEERIVEAGFPLDTLEPRITPEKHAWLLDLDQGRRIGAPFTEEELEAQVITEVEALRQFRPAAVYGGMNLPCAISSRAVGLPLLYLLPLAGTKTFFEHGLAPFPESRERWWSRPLPQAWKDRLFNWVMPRVRMGLSSYNKVARRHGAPLARSIWDVVTGELNLLTDLPALTGLPDEALPPGSRYVGPVFAQTPIPVPHGVRSVFNRPGLNIFCAMGSSTPAPILRKAAMALRDSGHNAVIVTTSVLDPGELDPLPDNVYATRFLPAPEVNRLADIAVIHGGQGTVQTACYAGTPIIGVAFQYEQHANLDMIERAGMGVRIPLNEFSGERLLDEVGRLVKSPSARKQAARISQLFQKTEGAANAAEAILNFLGR